MADEKATRGAPSQRPLSLVIKNGRRTPDEAAEQRLSTFERLHLENEARLEALGNGTDTRGFITRTLVQTTLPYREPKVEDHPNGFARRFQSFSLIIQAGSYTKTVEKVKGGRAVMETETHSYGFPYGSTPRLIVAWLCSEAMRQQSRIITLTDSQASFMRAIGMKNSTGGVRGTNTLLKDAMQRLFTARIITTSDRDAQKWRNGQFTIADDVELDDAIPWWAEDASTDRAPAWSSQINLSEKFYRDIVRSAVPVDLHVLKALHKSPMAMDIYSFLTWVNAFIEKPMELSWEGMAAQFGTSAQATRSFKQKWLEALAKVQVFYQPKVQVERTKLVILPSAPDVPKVKSKG
jgi:hypothetical protein